VRIQDKNSLARRSGLSVWRYSSTRLVPDSELTSLDLRPSVQSVDGSTNLHLRQGYHPVLPWSFFLRGKSLDSFQQHFRVEFDLFFSRFQANVQKILG
jgi:hypothetical protein